MQVVEHVLVKQVGLVDEQHGMHLLGTELLDMGADGEEDGRSRGARREAESEADVAIEVASAERDVVAVGEAEAILGEAVPQRAQHTRLADAGLADEHGVTSVATRLHQRLRGRLP